MNTNTVFRIFIPPKLGHENTHRENTPHENTPRKYPMKNMPWKYTQWKHTPWQYTTKDPMKIHAMTIHAMKKHAMKTHAMTIHTGKKPTPWKHTLSYWPSIININNTYISELRLYKQYTVWVETNTQNVLNFSIFTYTSLQG